MGITRRRVLQGMTVGAGLALGSGLRGSAVWAAPGVLAPGSRPDPSKPEGVDLLPQVDHIVIYMQENHSYDSYFGMLEIGDGYTLDGSGVPTESNLDELGVVHPLFRATDTSQLGPGVSQSWNNTHIQYDGGAMDGFVRNGHPNAMRYWDGAQLPFYWDLARTFPLCDRWFASAPCQTYPNRRYLQAATSVGIVSTSVEAVLGAPDAPNGTIWDRLNDHGVTWNDYAYDLPDLLLFPNVQAANTDHLRTTSQFLGDAARGTLPQVSIVSPGFDTYTEENPHDIQLGEAFTARIIDAVLHGPAWERTLLVFTYDEHGGYYDHVAPPPAVVPDSIPPQIAATDQPGLFDRYGFRVPGFVVSPYAKANHVSSTVYDHTSILRLIETKWNLGALTYRDANANDLLDTLDFSTMTFGDPPTLAAPGLPATGSITEPTVPDPRTIPLGAAVDPPTTNTPSTTAAPTSTAPITVTTTPAATAPTSTPGAGGATTAGTTLRTVASPTMTVGPLARTGSNPLGPYVVGASAVAAGLAVLAARSELLDARRPVPSFPEDDDETLT